MASTEEEKEKEYVAGERGREGEDWSVCAEGYLENEGGEEESDECAVEAGAATTFVWMWGGF